MMLTMMAILTFVTILICLLQSPRSGVSEPEPESPGDSGTDLRHDQPRSPGEEEEQDSSKMPTIGIRSDLLPTHPIPKEGLDMSHLHGLPALEALRRQAGNTNAFLSGLPGSPMLPSFPNSRPSQPPTPQSTGSNEMGGGSWTFEEQFKQVRYACFSCIIYLSSLDFLYIPFLICLVSSSK